MKKMVKTLEENEGNKRLKREVNKKYITKLLTWVLVSILFLSLCLCRRSRAKSSRVGEWVTLKTTRLAGETVGQSLLIFFFLFLVCFRIFIFLFFFVFGVLFCVSFFFGRFRSKKSKAAVAVYFGCCCCCSSSSSRPPPTKLKTAFFYWSFPFGAVACFFFFFSAAV